MRVKANRKGKVLFALSIACSNFWPSVPTALPNDVLLQSTPYNYCAKRSGVQNVCSMLKSNPGLLGNLKWGCLHCAVDGVRISRIQLTLRGGNSDQTYWNQV